MNKAVSVGELERLKHTFMLTSTERERRRIREKRPTDELEIDYVRLFT